MTGICKMCVKPRELVRSHLHPAALYDYCRKDGRSPIRLADGALYPTDRQVQDYVLCKECEDILNKGGETWVNPRLATWERTFPLYDLVTSRPAHGADADGFRIYFARQNLDVGVDKLIHFAIGIFWKAAVHSWPEMPEESKIELGPYADAIRRWLKGETAFPSHVYLHVVMSTPNAAQIALWGPYETPRDDARH